MPDRTAIQSLILESVQMLAEDFELEALKAPTHRPHCMERRLAR